MEESTSREKVLKKIRDGLIDKTEAPYPVIDQESSVYQEVSEDLDVAFAEQLVKVAGKFVYCENEEDFLATLQSFIIEKEWPVLFCFDPVLQDFLRKGEIPFNGDQSNITEAQIGITRCEYLVARLGTVMVSSKLSPGRKINVFPEIHLVVGYTSQLVPDLKQAFTGMKKRYPDNYPSLVSLITGPSRTADIEKTLVMGAHGPKELYVFLIENNEPGYGGQQ
jgi:L-lactate dehydrogenase complex protein LldG